MSYDLNLYLTKNRIVSAKVLCSLISIYNCIHKNEIKDFSDASFQIRLMKVVIENHGALDLL